MSVRTKRSTSPIALIGWVTDGEVVGSAIVDLRGEGRRPEAVLAVVHTPAKGAHGGLNGGLRLHQPPAAVCGEQVGLFRRDTKADFFALGVSVDALKADDRVGPVAKRAVDQ